MPEVDALATIRPDDWNLALFLHVLGAMVVVGAWSWRSSTSPPPGAARRRSRCGPASAPCSTPGSPPTSSCAAAPSGSTRRRASTTLPTDPAWIGIGYITADAGLLLLLVATITTGIASRRANAAEATTEAAPRTTGVRVSATLCALLLVGYVIAIWAMTAKPA